MFVNICSTKGSGFCARSGLISKRNPENAAQMLMSEMISSYKERVSEKMKAGFLLLFSKLHCL